MRFSNSMLKTSCLLLFPVFALFASGCESPDKPEPAQTKPKIPDVVKLTKDTAIPVFVSSVTNPDDAFWSELLLSVDSDYQNSTKFGRQDTFAAKKTRLMREASAVKGKMILVTLQGTLRSDQYDQTEQSYPASDDNGAIFGPQTLRDDDHGFFLNIIVDNRPARIQMPESMARAIASVNDYNFNVVMKIAANVVPQSADTVTACWAARQNSPLHVELIDAVVYAKSPRGDLVKVGTLRFKPNRK